MSGTLLSARTIVLFSALVISTAVLQAQMHMGGMGAGMPMLSPTNSTSMPMMQSSGETNCLGTATGMMSQTNTMAGAHQMIMTNSTCPLHPAVTNQLAPTTATVAPVTVLASASLPTAAAIAQPSVSLDFYAGILVQGEVGQTMQVHYRDALDVNAPWQELTTFVMNKSAELVIDVDSPKVGRRFYRATLLE